MKNLKFVCSLFLLSFLVACGTTTPDQNNAQADQASAPTATENAKLEFEQKKVHKKKNIGDNTVEYKISYPYFKENSDFAKKLNESIRKTANPFEDHGLSIEEAAENFIKDGIKDLEEGAIAGYDMDINIKVFRNDDKIFTLEISSSSFTGGAHGASSVIYENYKPQTGKAITLSDVVKDKNNPSFNGVGERYFKAARDIMESADLSSFDFFLDNGGNFFYNENFAINDEDMIFYYNEYEVAPYADGPTEMKIPLDELGSFLKDEFK